MFYAALTPALSHPMGEGETLPASWQINDCLLLDGHASY